MPVNQYKPSQFQSFPPVVKNLLIINAIMFFATVVTNDKLGFDLNNLLGLHFPASEYFKPFQYITYMFMHGNITHIFFNMLALWMFGSALENIWGSKRFISYYMICGVGAALFNTVISYYDLESTRAAITQFNNSGTAAAFELFLHKQNILTNPDSLISNILNYINGYRPPQQLINYIDQWKHNPGDPHALLEAKSF